MSETSVSLREKYTDREWRETLAGADLPRHHADKVRKAASGSLHDFAACPESIRLVLLGLFYRIRQPAFFDGIDDALRDPGGCPDPVGALTECDPLQQDILVFYMIRHASDYRILQWLTDLENAWLLRYGGEFLHERLSFRHLAGTADSGDPVAPDSVFRQVRLYREQKILAELASRNRARPTVFAVYGRRNRPWAWLDTESNGSDEFSREIVELALVPFADGRSSLTFHRSPVRGDDCTRRRLDGDNDDRVDLVEPETSLEEIRAILNRCRGHVLVAHNAEHDAGMIGQMRECLARPECRTDEGYSRFMRNMYTGYEILQPTKRQNAFHVVDTLDIACLVLPQLDGHRLEDLAKHYGLGQQQHRAMQDALQLREAVCRMAEDIGNDAPLAAALALLPRAWYGFRLLEIFVPGLRPESLPERNDGSGKRRRMAPFRAFCRTFPRHEAPENDNVAGLDPGRMAASRIVSSREGRAGGGDARIGVEDCAASRAFGGDRTRPAFGAQGRAGAQYSIMNAIVRGINERRLTLVEAGTGVGKTDGYLVPVLEFLARNPGERYVVAAHTKLQQDQIFKSAHRIIKDNGYRIGHVMIKGKANYLCLEHFVRSADAAVREVASCEKRLEQGQPEPENLDSARRRLVWSVQILTMLVRGVPDDEGNPVPWDGQLDDVPFHMQETWDPDGSARRDAAWQEHGTICDECSFKSSCFIMEKLDRLEDPENRLIIANEAIVLTRKYQANAMAAGQEPVETTSFADRIRDLSGNLVLDEAHNLEATCRDINAVHFDGAALQSIRHFLFSLRDRLAGLFAVSENDGDDTSAAEEGASDQDEDPRLRGLLAELAPLREEQHVALAELDRLVREFIGEDSSEVLALYGERRRLTFDAASARLVQALAGLSLLRDVNHDFDCGEFSEIVSGLDMLCHAASSGYALADGDVIGLTGRIRCFLEACAKKNFRDMSDPLSVFLAALPERFALDAPRKKKALRWLAEWRHCRTRLAEVLAPQQAARIWLRDAFRAILLAVYESACDGNNRAGEIQVLFRILGGEWLVEAEPSLDNPAADLCLKPEYDCNYELGFSLDRDGSGSVGREEGDDGETLPAGDVPGLKLRKSGSGHWDIWRFERDVRELVGVVLETRDRLTLVSATLGLDDLPAKTVYEDNLPCPVPLLFRTGLDKRSLLALREPSPYDIRNNMRVVVPADMPFPVEGQEESHAAAAVVAYARLARLLPLLADKFSAKALFLFSSRLARDTAAGLLASHPVLNGIRAAVQGRGSVRKVTDWFVKAGHALMFGSRSFGEGFDIVDAKGGDAAAAGRNPIRIVVIDKLPFPSKCEPVHDAVVSGLDFSAGLARHLQNRDERKSDDVIRNAARVRPPRGDSFNSYVLPLALVTFRQWAGRLLRTQQDSGFLFVLDPRLTAKPFGYRFLSGFDDCVKPLPVRICGSVHTRARARYHARLTSLRAAAITGKIQFADWNVPPFQAPSFFHELIDDPLFSGDVAARIGHETGIHAGETLPDRIRFLLDEHAAPGYHGPAVTLDRIGELRPLFRMIDALFGSAREKADWKTGEELAAALEDWSLRESFPVIWRKIVDNLASREYRVPTRTGDEERFRNLLEVWTVAWLRFHGNSAPENAADSLLALVESLNKGLNPVFCFERNRIDINGQYQVARTVMQTADKTNGRDTHCFFSLPTSFGKSACFQAPALLASGLTVVIEPTQVLVRSQVVDLLRRHPEALGSVAGLCADFGDVDEIAGRLAREGGDLRLLYLTAKQVANHRIWSALLARRDLVRFVFDEYHSIVQWGQGKLTPEYGVVFALIGHCRRLAVATGRPPPTVNGFTATATARLDELLVRDFFPLAGIKAKDVRFFKSGVDRPDIELRIVRCRATDALEKVAEIASAFKPYVDKRLFVFCKFAGRGNDWTQRTGVLQVAEKLRSLPNLVADPERDVFHFFSGLGLTSGERDRGLNHAPVIVATEALGMGIDMKNIAGVLLFDLPDSVENVIQFFGRARTKCMHDPDEAGKRAWILDREGDEDAGDGTFDQLVRVSFDKMKNGFAVCKWRKSADFNDRIWLVPQAIPNDKKFYSLHPWVLFGKPFHSLLVPFDNMQRKLFASNALDCEINTWCRDWSWDVALNCLARRAGDIRMLWRVPAVSSVLLLGDAERRLDWIEALPGGLEARLRDRVALLAVRNKLLVRLDDAFSWDEGLFHKTVDLLRKAVVRYSRLDGLQVVTLAHLLYGQKEDGRDSLVMSLYEKLDVESRPCWALYLFDALLFFIESGIISRHGSCDSAVLQFPPIDEAQCIERLEPYRTAISGTRLPVRQLSFSNTSNFLEEERATMRVIDALEGMDDELRTIVGRGKEWRAQVQELIAGQNDDSDGFRLQLVGMFNEHERDWLARVLGRNPRPADPTSGDTGS